MPYFVFVITKAVLVKKMIRKERKDRQCVLTTDRGDTIVKAPIWNEIHIGAFTVFSNLTLIFVGF